MIAIEPAGSRSPNPAEPWNQKFDQRYTYGTSHAVSAAAALVLGQGVCDTITALIVTLTTAEALAVYRTAATLPGFQRPSTGSRHHIVDLRNFIVSAGGLVASSTFDFRTTIT